MSRDRSNCGQIVVNSTRIWGCKIALVSLCCFCPALRFSTAGGQQRLSLSDRTCPRNLRTRLHAPAISLVLQPRTNPSAVDRRADDWRSRPFRHRRRFFCAHMSGWACRHNTSPGHAHALRAGVAHRARDGRWIWMGFGAVSVNSSRLQHLCVRSGATPRRRL
jgi:hypothetical protein